MLVPAVKVPAPSVKSPERFSVALCASNVPAARLMSSFTSTVPARFTVGVPLDRLIPNPVFGPITFDERVREVQVIRVRVIGFRC